VLVIDASHIAVQQTEALCCREEVGQSGCGEEACTMHMALSPPRCR
jgi:hypothetical protein